MVAILLLWSLPKIQFDLLLTKNVIYVMDLPLVPNFQSASSKIISRSCVSSLDQCIPKVVPLHMRGIMYTNQQMSDQHINDTIDYLNDILRVDPKAITALIKHRVPCKKELGSHRQLQAAGLPDGGFEVGMLGVINGIFGTIQRGPRTGWGFITAVFNDNGTLVYFMRTKENPKLNSE